MADDPNDPTEPTEPTDPILEALPLGFQWPTLDPFLFCAHHQDAYPAGDERLGPAASLEGRTIGEDFEGKDGWRMYHGDVVPGFPQHPHRGFETVTIVRRGFVDHSDSLGATCRYGPGDVQWLTAGRGINHAEMFPLLDREGPNPAELFQLWLNLPARSKLAAPRFSMLWREAIPRHVARDRAGRRTEIDVIAGALEGVRPLSPPPESWAARPEADVAIWSLAMEPGAAWTLPPARAGTGRVLYFHEGEALEAAGRRVGAEAGLVLRPDAPVPLVNGARPSRLLLLQGRPIGEPVAQYGPFVMNTRAEIEEAFADFRRTGFGGWPWESDGPVHPRDAGRFARTREGDVEQPVA
jgi:redox-sensitive bicupin YhaK (pirin superfamily)